MVKIEFVRMEGVGHHFHKALEILLPFSGARVHAVTCTIKRCILNARIEYRLMRRAECKRRVAAAESPGFRILSGLGDRPVLDFRGDLRAKVSSREDGRIVDA